jgi:arylsulfatase
MPDKLKQMEALFYSEAAKYNVLPLDNSSLSRWNAERPNLTGGRKSFTYTGTLIGVPNSGAPSILNKAYTITAEVTIPEGGGEGMIVTDGGRFGGYALFLSPGFNWWSNAPFFRNLGLGILALGVLLVLRGGSKRWSRPRMVMSRMVMTGGALLVLAVLGTRLVGVGQGRPVFLYNLLDLKRTDWSGPSLGAGKHTIVFAWKPTEAGLGKGGTGVLSVDGKDVATNTMENSTPITFPEDETFDIGEDTRTGVALLKYRYEVPFPFTGTIDKLTFDLEPQQLTAEDQKNLPAVAEAVARARD